MADRAVCKCGHGRVHHSAYKPFIFYGMLLGGCFVPGCKCRKQRANPAPSKPRLSRRGRG
jgi:hypothetical protein